MILNASMALAGLFITLMMVMARPIAFGIFSAAAVAFDAVALEGSRAASPPYRQTISL